MLILGIIINKYIHAAFSTQRKIWGVYMIDVPAYFPPQLNVLSAD